MQNIYGLTKKELEEYFTMIGEKKFKATQIYEWLYEKRVTTYEEMTNIKKELQITLKNTFSMHQIKIIRHQHDKDTHKFLFELADKNYVEAVLMQHDYGLSICVSSEVGCNMGCSFCESGRLKKVRNLESYEMVCQLLLAEEVIKKRISSVVVMGIGEPFDNYENLMKFIRIINDPKGLAIGARHITVSTCGLIPKIKEFASENLQVNLAISLHAPNNEIRNQLMPVNKVYSIDQLIPTIKEYIDKTNRRVTIEYVMLKSVNDSVSNAYELAQLLKGLNIYVNLIPYNQTNHNEYQKSPQENIQKFYDTLKKEGINVTVRKEFGSKIDAACGQLRSKEVQ